MFLSRGVVFAVTTIAVDLADINTKNIPAAAAIVFYGIFTS